MTEWWTYRPEDFLLFSETVYWRLFELHNDALWPAPVLALLLGAGVLSHLAWPREWSGRFAGLVLAAAWIVVAWAFFWARYAPVNWAAAYVAPVFVVEGLMLAILGLRDRIALGGAQDIGPKLGLGLFVYALCLHPFVAVFDGRGLAGAEMFGMAPDPTAIATLGVLALAQRRAATWLLLPVPVLWCVASWLTLDTMGTWEGWIPLAAAVAGVAAFLLPRHGRAS